MFEKLCKNSPFINSIILINTEGLLQSCVSSRGLCKNLVTPGGSAYHRLKTICEIETTWKSRNKMKTKMNEMDKGRHYLRKR